MAAHLLGCWELILRAGPSAQHFGQGGPGGGGRRPQPARAAFASAVGEGLLSRHQQLQREEMNAVSSGMARGYATASRGGLQSPEANVRAQGHGPGLGLPSSQARADNGVTFNNSWRSEEGRGSASQPDNQECPGGFRAFLANRGGHLQLSVPAGGGQDPAALGRRVAGGGRARPRPGAQTIGSGRGISPAESPCHSNSWQHPNNTRPDNNHRAEHVPRGDHAAERGVVLQNGAAAAHAARNVTAAEAERPQQRLQRTASTGLRAVHFKNTVLWQKGSSTSADQTESSYEPSSGQAQPSRPPKRPKVQGSKAAKARAGSLTHSADARVRPPKTVWSNVDKAKFISVLEKHGKSLQHLREALPDR